MIDLNIFTVNQNLQIGKDHIEKQNIIILRNENI